MARIWVTFARQTHRPMLASAYSAERDRTLATMTHMLASSSQSTKKNSEGRVRRADFELVSMICVSEQRKLNNTNQGETLFERLCGHLYRSLIWPGITSRDTLAANCCFMSPNRRRKAAIT